MSRNEEEAAKQEHRRCAALLERRYWLLAMKAKEARMWRGGDGDIERLKTKFRNK